MKHLAAAVGATWVLLIFLSLAMLGVGWVLNIIDLFGLIGNDFTVETAFRALGIFVPPLGGILGWF